MAQITALAAKQRVAAAPQRLGCNWKYRSRIKRPPQEGGQFRMSDADALIRAICSLGCSTTARIVIGRRCGSGGAGLRGLYHDRSRGSRCRATDDRTGRTAHGGPNWPTYDGSGYGAARCSRQSTVVIGDS